MILLAISWVLFGCYALLLATYCYGWHKRKPESSVPGSFIPKTSVSVLIPARNEAAQIGYCLQSILTNDYPADLLEVIVIDDYSTDATTTIAEEFLKGGKGKVLRLQDYLSKNERLNAYKKKALEIAIDAASGDWIITTDADCTCPPGWLRELVYLKEHSNAQFIAAPVSFTPAMNKKNILYYFQSLDFMTMQGITAAAAALNLGNMCNGANLAFHQKAFHEVGGYKDIDHIASGDDMLLMHKIQQRYPDGIRYLKSRAAIVRTPAQPRWRDFLNQRIRWSSKADKYDDKKLIWILMAIYFFNLSFILLLITCFFDTTLWIGLLGLLTAKTGIELVFLIPVARFYRKEKELIYFPLLQPLHILYIIVAGFLGKFGRYQWKGRTVH